MNTRRGARTASFAPHIVTAILFVAACAAPVFGQGLGAKGGLDLTTTVDKNETISSSVGAGMFGGAVINVHLTGRLGLNVEGLLSQQRTHFEDVVLDTLTYVEIPALIRYQLMGDRERGAVAVTGGAVYRWLWRAEETIGGVTSDVIDALQSSDLGVAIGGDVQIMRRFAATVRYVHGLEDVYKGLGDTTYGRHRTLQVGATYWIK